MLIAILIMLTINAVLLGIVWGVQDQLAKWVARFDIRIEALSRQVGALVKGKKRDDNR